MSPLRTRRRRSGHRGQRAVSRRCREGRGPGTCRRPLRHDGRPRPEHPDLGHGARPRSSALSRRDQARARAAAPGWPRRSSRRARVSTPSGRSPRARSARPAPRPTISASGPSTPPTAACACQPRSADQPVDGRAERLRVAVVRAAPRCAAAGDVAGPHGRALGAPGDRGRGCRRGPARAAPGARSIPDGGGAARRSTAPSSVGVRSVGRIRRIGRRRVMPARRTSPSQHRRTRAPDSGVGTSCADRGRDQHLLGRRDQLGQPVAGGGRRARRTRRRGSGPARRRPTQSRSYDASRSASANDQDSPWLRVPLGRQPSPSPSEQVVAVRADEA